jgi:hypothetical protein
MVNRVGKVALLLGTRPHASEPPDAVRENARFRWPLPPAWGLVVIAAAVTSDAQEPWAHARTVAEVRDVAPSMEKHLLKDIFMILRRRDLSPDQREYRPPVAGD